MDLHPLVHIHDLGIAYLDGGTGSMMLQAAIALVLSVGYVAKTRWQNLKAVISTKLKRSNSR